MAHLTRPNCPGLSRVIIKGFYWASLRPSYSTEVGGERVLWVHEILKAWKRKYAGISYLQVKCHRNAGTPKDVYENVPSSTRIMFKHPETQMPTSSRRGKETEVCSQEGTPDGQEEGSQYSEGGAHRWVKGRKRPENQKNGTHTF